MRRIITIVTITLGILLTSAMTMKVKIIPNEYDVTTNENVKVILIDKETNEEYTNSLELEDENCTIDNLINATESEITLSFYAEAN